MTTTFEKYANTQRGNYCTLPTINVEIVEPRPACKTCDQPITYSGGRYFHSNGDTEHYASPRPTCRYCGTNEPDVVVYHQRSWSDELECSRCGGIDGHPIGD